MVNIQRKKKLKRILYSKITIAVLVVLTVLLANATWNAYQNTRFTERNEEEALRELESLEERANFLRTETAKLRTPEGIEREIRENLPVAKEGEKVIILVEENEDGVQEATSSEAREEGFWQRFFPWI